MNTLNVDSIHNTLSSLKGPITPEGLASSIKSGVGSAIKDPVGAVIVKTLSSINTLTASIESKITKLEEDIVKSLDNTGKVKLVDNKIIITLEPEDINKLAGYQSKIQGDIDKVNNLISKLSVTISSLSIVAKTAEILKVALDVQEVLLKLNPVSNATLTVFKKAIKILFYKDVLNEYSKILKQQVSENTAVLQRLLDKFKGLSVEFKINTANNSGIKLTQAEASTATITAGLGGDRFTEDYDAFNGKTYTLLIEKYGDRELIGRAKDKFSGLLITETAPTFSLTKDQLIIELKTILNNY